MPSRQLQPGHDVSVINHCQELEKLPSSEVLHVDARVAGRLALAPSQQRLLGALGILTLNLGNLNCNRARQKVRV